MPPSPIDRFSVLVVDDEPETCDLLSEHCRSRGLDVSVAQDGRAAIAALERNPAQFAMVLTDLHMPGADGFEVLKRARAANPSAYVVMMTGYATIDSALRAVREGAYDYLPKPFSLGQLDVVLARVRDRMALERENRDLHRMTKNAPAAGAPASADTGWRLAAIEERLTTIEALLRALATNPLAR
jgi:two-component system response regulator HydG